MSSELWSTSPWQPIDGAPARPPLPSAPRLLPTWTRLALLTHGVLANLGFAFFAMGMFMVLAFVRPVELARGPLAHLGGALVEGEVERLADTNVYINDERVVAVHARFELDGAAHAVTSYTVGPALSPGAKVPVTVLAASPSIAVIEGMTSSSTPLFVVPVLFFFPLIGAVFLLIAIGRGLRWVRLLERGVEAEGRLVSNEETGARVNNVPVRKLVFHFQDRAGDTWPAEARATDTTRLTDEPTERVLYLAHDPRHAIVIDEIPDWLTILNGRWGEPPSSAKRRVALRLGGTAVVFAVALAINLAME